MCAATRSPIEQTPSHRLRSACAQQLRLADFSVGMSTNDSKFRRLLSAAKRASGREGFPVDKKPGEAFKGDWICDRDWGGVGARWVKGAIRVTQIQLPLRVFRGFYRTVEDLRLPLPTYSSAIADSVQRGPADARFR